LGVCVSELCCAETIIGESPVEATIALQRSVAGNSQSMKPIN